MTQLKNWLVRAYGCFAWVIRHPIALLRFASAMQRQDDRFIARHLEGDLERAVGFRLMVRGGVQEATFSRAGISWRTDLGPGIGRSLWRFGGYETDAIDAVVRWMRANGRGTGVVIDVGANIGTTTVPFVQSGYRVLAVEPVPHTFDMLTTNIRANGFDSKVIQANYAIGATDTEVRMWTGFGSGLGEVAVEDQAPDWKGWRDRAEQVTVRSMPLSQLIIDKGIALNDVALVWSDAQGSETQVILSAVEAWAAGVPLFAEVDPRGLELHGGLAPFIDAAQRCFTQYVSRDDLISGRDPQPMASFSRWVGSIGPSSYSDVLLIPR